MTITPARLEVLKRCATGEGLRPLGPDWYAIYWLREHGYVVNTAPTKPPGLHAARYVPTPSGSNLLKSVTPLSHET